MLKKRISIADSLLFFIKKFTTTVFMKIKVVSTLKLLIQIFLFRNSRQDGF